MAASWGPGGDVAAKNIRGLPAGPSSQLSGFFRAGRKREDVGARDVDLAVLAGSVHPNAPRIAADLAVLDQRAPDVGLEIDFHLLATVRTGDEELIAQRVEDVAETTRRTASMTSRGSSFWILMCSFKPSASAMRSVVDGREPFESAALNRTRNVPNG